MLYSLLLMCGLTCGLAQASDNLVTVIVTYMEDLPVNVGNGSSAAPTPSIVAADVPGVQLVSDLPYLGEAIYRGTSPTQDADDLCEAIMMYRNVETCEPDSSGSIDQTATPNDPAYSNQGYLNTTGVVGLWQQNVFGDPRVRVGIIDSGVDLSSSDLAPSLWTNPDETDNGRDNDNDGVPGDVHCASFLGGVASGNCSDANGVSCMSMLMLTVRSQQSTI